MDKNTERYKEMLAKMCKAAYNMEKASCEDDPNKWLDSLNDLMEKCKEAEKELKP